MNANREIFTACLPAAETWLQRRHNSAEEELTMVKKKTDKELKELEKKIGKVPKFFRELTEKEPKMMSS